MNTFELKTPSGIELFAQVMEPLATEPLVVLTSASPIVGELLGENRILVCHSATGYASGPRTQSLRFISAAQMEARHRHACRAGIAMSPRSVMGAEGRRSVPL